VSRTYPKILRNRKQRIERRLARRQYEDRPDPMFKAGNIHYEMAERSQGMSYGGLGAMHAMLCRLGLPKEINDSLCLLKTHVPYWESDHVLNMAYNVCLGGVRLEDIEQRRNDEVFLNALGVERIPDPTTAGDFTRRFDAGSIGDLMEAINRVRVKVWRKRGRKRLRDAKIDMDGTLAPMVVVRKNISREKGEEVLLPEIRHFFYVTTREDLSRDEVVREANERCDQENVIEQAKNGVNALRMPVDNLVSNWACMVMAALVWNFKAWFAMVVRFQSRGDQLLRMEYRSFLHAMILLPVQIVLQGRKVIWRLTGYNAWLKDFFSAWEFIRRARFT
jgi:hypothetical protein